MKEFVVVTSAQVEREYIVSADDEKQAKDRLRIYLKDSEMIREGLVTNEKPPVNTTPEKIRKAVEKAKPALLTPNSSTSSSGSTSPAVTKKPGTAK